MPNVKAERVSSHQDESGQEPPVGQIEVEEFDLGDVVPVEVLKQGRRGRMAVWRAG